jgi:hypothetical protein
MLKHVIWSVVFLWFATSTLTCPADAAPIASKFPEGVAHGHLLVRSTSGELVGHGELVQVLKEGDLVESRLTFRFKDGSLYDEKVAFSQRRVFTLIRYHLIQRGPFFPDQVEITMDRGTGDYQARSKGAKDEKEEVRSGHLDLPNDVYNGMLVMLLKNLPHGRNETVSLMAFTPEPQLVELHLLFLGDHPIQIGGMTSKARRYAFEPEVGKVREVVGKVLGKLPARFHYECWILADEPPGFVQFEGRLQVQGPMVRIEMASPRVPVKQEESTEK